MVGSAGAAAWPNAVVLTLRRTSSANTKSFARIIKSPFAFPNERVPSDRYCSGQSPELHRPGRYAVVPEGMEEAITPGCRALIEPRYIYLYLSMLNLEVRGH